ncbi:UNVERIFIED_CONTAM: hypothetical protein PYX00_002159 [Menopon gallinae]|uniref:Pre-mRNA polyadenylation factor Fip1 domain-containing protein n=1 Tax=Menopon gallinae TaxID=328185 RepID=A0AAW2IFU7_9NEOP
MADEDERWLYGDSAQEENENPPQKEPEPAEKEEETPAEPPKTEEEKPPGKEPEEEKIEEPVKEPAESSENKEAEGKENGEIGEEEEAAEEEDDDEDDSDEDNVHVIIGDINRSSPSYTNINISKRGPTIPAPGVKSTGKFSIEDFESVGVINGVPAHEFNVDVLEEKPWRIPGADITDYFNYGFNEDTWKAYCERQKRIRIHESFTGLPMQQTGQSWQNSQGGQSNQYSNMMLGGKKAGWETGQIRVIGSGVASRRIDEDGSDNQNIQVIPSNNSFSIS